jgi:hypothetical protein
MPKKLKVSLHYSILEDNISDKIATHNFNTDIAKRLSKSSNFNPSLNFYFRARIIDNDQTI